MRVSPATELCYAACLAVRLLLNMQPSPDHTEVDVLAPSRRPQPGIWVWLGVIVAIVGVSATVVFWRMLRESEQANAKRLTNLAAEAIRADLSEDFYERLNAIQRMSKVWGLESPASTSERRAFAKAFIEGNPGCGLIGFVDPSHHVAELVSIDKNDEFLGENPSSDPSLSSALRSASESRHLVVTAGTDLSAKGFLWVAVPVHSKEEFRGFVIAKMDVQQTLADILTTVSALGYSVVVFENGREVYSAGIADRTLARDWGQQVELRLPGAAWTIQALPEPDVLSTFRTPLPQIALGLGMAVTCLLVILLFFAQMISNRSRELELTNARLTKSFEERRAGLKALQESEARFSGILEMSTDGIVSTNEKQQIVLFNRGAEAIFGYAAHEIIGKPLSLLIPGRFQRSHHEYVNQFGEKADSTQPMSPVRPVLGLRKDGTEFPIEASISKLTLNGERVYTAIVRDATERHEAEDALRKMHALLEQRVLERTAELENTNAALQQEIEVRNKAEEMLSQLSGRLLQLQDEERRRVARELHDSTAQYLAALALNISSVKTGADGLPGELKLALSDALDLVDRCSSEIRTMSYLLHPPLLDELGLVPALEWYAAGFSKRSGVAVALELPPKEIRIPTEFERTLFRIVQECLTNARKHSGASVAKILLTVAPDEIRLDVRDDGHGIPGFARIEMTDDVVSLLGVGIAGMRERVRQLGGRLEISSGDDGTVVTTVLALQEQIPTSSGANA